MAACAKLRQPIKEHVGAKGDKMTGDSVLLAELLEEKLSTLNKITFKKMFGGHGIFSDGKMFGMVSAKGFAFLKVDAELRAKFEKAGSEPHSKMPYSSIPQEVLDDTDLLLEWCAQSIQLTK